MNKQIGILIFVGSLFFAAAPQANAHDYDQSRYDSTSRYHADVRRNNQMPRWLSRDKGFRHWYRRSSLKRNYSLVWWQLFDIYRWERRHSSHRPRRNYYGFQNRDYDWYRRYWRHYDDNRQRPRRSERNRQRG